MDHFTVDHVIAVHSLHIMLQVRGRKFLSRLVLLNLNPNSKKSKFIHRIGLLNENTHDSLQLRVSCLRTHQADLIHIILKSESNWTPTGVLHDVITFLGLLYPTVETRQFYHQQQVFSSGNPHLRKKIRRKPHQQALPIKKNTKQSLFVTSPFYRRLLRGLI